MPQSQPDLDNSSLRCSCQVILGCWVKITCYIAQTTILCAMCRSPSWTLFRDPLEVFMPLIGMGARLPWSLVELFSVDDSEAVMVFMEGHASQGCGWVENELTVSTPWGKGPPKRIRWWWRRRGQWCNPGLEKWSWMEVGTRGSLRPLVNRTCWRSGCLCRG